MNTAPEPSDIEPSRYADVSSTALNIIGTAGESRRFEFKETDDAVTATVLVAAANSHALHPDQGPVTILVGVAEVEDPTSGLVTGKIAGLHSVERSVGKIRSRAKSTLPIPIGLRIIEEGASTKIPFLRLEVSSTAAPHYDESGRRVTRYEASTRALTDQELLDIYLGRESAAFERRFISVAGPILGQLSALDATVARTARDFADLEDAIGGATSAAMDASSESQDAQMTLRALEAEVERVRELLTQDYRQGPTSVALQLRWERRRLWRLFLVDAIFRPSKAAEKAEERLHRLLARPVDIRDSVQNLRELQELRNMCDEHKWRMAMKWWMKQIRTLEGISDTTLLRPELEERETVDQLIQEAQYWSDLAIAGWD